MPRPTIKPLPAEERLKIDEWVNAQGDCIPDYIRVALEQHGLVCEALDASTYKRRQIFAELKRALGITASSEKRTSNDPIGAVSQGDGKRPKDKLEQLLLAKERLENLISWHRKLARQQSKKVKVIKDKIMQEEVKAEDIELTAEEEAELAEEDRQFKTRLNLGEGADPEFQSVTETMMTGTQAMIEEHREAVPADLTAFPQAEVVNTMVEERERYDFSFSVTRVVLEVEKKIIKDADGMQRMVSGSTKQWGPPGYAVTWEFLAHMVILIVQYAIPMNRLGKMLSTEEHEFTASYFSRLVNYVARRFLPIYLNFFDSLSDSEVLMGDDTSPRVLEVNRFFKNKSPPQEAPWFKYRTREQAAQTDNLEEKPSLGVLLAKELGFEFEYLSKPGTKRSLNTTTISGRSIARDPRSLIVAYRSHLGGFGNLLNMLLEKRLPENKDLTILSDFLTANLVSNPELIELFNIKYAGCTSHARRPLALYEHEDPDMCDRMLHLFKGLFLYERSLDVWGRNRENVKAVRDVDSRNLWSGIKELAEEMAQKWPPSSKLGEGARYIVRNFKKLTAYLEDPRLEITNNFSERMLRIEKLIEDSALFRSGLEGRFALDIIRSVIQTAIATQVPVPEYLLYVLRSPIKEIEENPDRFTPLAYAMLLKTTEPPPKTFFLVT